ncbi:hypothetical protein [Flavobacterium defluvii]|nr:hypothetical protein [Flavobacterium defluvii]
MNKLPGQGGLTKKITVAKGNVNRRKFAKKAATDLSHLISQVSKRKTIEMEVASFSSCNDFHEQLLSVLSFIRYVGRPIKWTIYSDGSHNEEQIEQLENSFDFVKVEKGLDWTKIQSLKGLCKEELEPYENYLMDYAKKFPLGKKLFYYLNHTIEKPTLFIDSDILFYEHANVLKLILTEKPAANGWYMPDVSWGCLDSRYKAANTEQIYQVNSGFIFANTAFEHIKESLEFFKTYNFIYEYFSEQTVYHHLLKNNSYMPLTPKTFILDLGDQFDFSYLLSPKQMAVRHYTGPVRHKMWQRNYKWHLGL